MKHIEQGFFLGFILAWMALVSADVTFRGLVHALPLMAVCILANRVRRCTAEPGSARLATINQATPNEATINQAEQPQLSAP